MTIKRHTRPWLAPLALALSCAPAWSAPPGPAAAASAAAPIPTTTASAAASTPATVASAAASAPAMVASAATPEPAWHIERGQSISQALAAWATRAGWVLQWEPSSDWLAPQATVFRGDFMPAAKALIEVMAAEGADIRATFYQGNKTLVIRAGGNHE